MKKLLIVLIIALVLVLSACDKTTEQTDTTPTLFEPFVDDDGKLNVDVSDYEFE